MDVPLNNAVYVKQESTCEQQTTETIEIEGVTEKPPCVIESVYVKMSPSKEKDKIKSKYTDEDLKNAVDALRNGKGLRETAKAFGIPHATLHDRISGRRPVAIQQRGPEPILGVEGEDSIKDWLVTISRRGFTVKKVELLDTIQKIIIDNGIPNPFKDGRPGQTWYKNFLKRHPDLPVGTPKGIDKKAITEESISSWFANLKSFLKETNNDDILESPERIFSGDECSFSVCPKTGEVAPKIKPGDEKQNLTAFVTCNAKGQMCPPLVVFPCKRLTLPIAESMPGHWCMGQSDSGQMTRKVIYEYVANGFYKWVERNQIQKPILLLVDGCSSQISLVLSAICDELQIILYALPPNATHLLQPIEVSVFTTLKFSWEEIASNFLSMPENLDSPCVTKTNFCKLFKEIIEDTDTEKNIQNGFKICGLYPFNPKAVDTSKSVQNALENYKHSKPTIDSKEISYEDIIATEKVLKHLKPVLKQNNIDVDLIIREVRKLKKPETDSGSDSESENDSGSINGVPVTEPSKQSEKDKKIATNCPSRIGDENGNEEIANTNESSTSGSDTSSSVSQDELDNGSSPTSKSVFSGHLFYPESPERTHTKNDKKKAKLPNVKATRKRGIERSEKQGSKRKRQ